MNGQELPRVTTPIPGPKSRALAARLQRVESPNITAMEPQPPIFWEAASGANVRDVDGNVFVDLTSGFGVANAGHANPRVVEALSKQAGRLAHALGDVYPADIKVRLLERIADILPGNLQVTILGNSGSEAIEAALKTAVLRTGRTGVLAFKNAYHGLTYGALSITHRPHFRDPFKQQLFDGVRFATFPESTSDRTEILREIDAVLDRGNIGCIIAEPIQGRGGIVVPPDWFLAELRERCDGQKTILVLDEIYVGCGRTGKWLACEHWHVTPDIAVIGKGLTGTLPLSAAVGTPEVMSGWPLSTGEAIHTNTFIGNPVACAAALAQIEEIESRQLLPRATQLGDRIRNRFNPIRGMGLIQGIPLDSAEQALRVVNECMQHGVLLLVEGTDANVLAITPPAVITEQQLDHALDVVERCLTH